jgi:erythronate-4-phosphate dehydrogenase
VSYSERSAAGLRILADENIPAVEHYAGSSASVSRFGGRELRPAQLTGVDVLLVRSVTRVDEALLAGSDVRYVGTATSGVDHIDRDYLHQRGIAFSHAPGSNANSVVEYVLAAIAASDDHLERVLAGAAVGIIGYGVIGKAVAARLQALGINYRVYDPWLTAPEVACPSELSGILDCDVITLHAELTRELPWPSYHLLGEEQLAQISRDSLLINASRGPVVDNAVLSSLLARGSGLEVVLDVWEGEPQIASTLLQQVQYGTPHIAGYSLDGKLLATRMLFEAMSRQLNVPWRDPGSAAGDAPVLQIPNGGDGAALLRTALAQRYDITADAAALRAATLGASPATASSAFDQLRRNYPDRREIMGSRVAPGRFITEAQALLLALGCRLEDSEQ